MNYGLSYYVHCFTHLKRDRKNGGAPHKPVLLLSIIQLFERNLFLNNQICVIPELVSSFKVIWSKLVVTNHYPIFALPYYHMGSEPFWRLVANAGCEKWVESKSSMRSFSNLTTAVKYALIDKDLSDLLLQQESRDVLKASILDKYFPDTKQCFNITEKDDILSGSILHSPSDEYKRRIIEMKNTIEENAFQEEIFIRGGLFKREIPKIYNYTCAISGLRVSAIANVSMVDACHIVPFSDCYDDTLSNGIALCPNLHRAFDRGLVAISDDYTVLVKSDFVENKSSPFNISQFAGKHILLPVSKELYPSLDNLAKHRNKFSF